MDGQSSAEGGKRIINTLLSKTEEKLMDECAINYLALKDEKIA